MGSIWIRKKKNLALDSFWKLYIIFQFVINCFHPWQLFSKFSMEPKIDYPSPWKLVTKQERKIEIINQQLTNSKILGTKGNEYQRIIICWFICTRNKLLALHIHCFDPILYLALFHNLHLMKSMNYEHLGHQQIASLTLELGRNH